MDDKLIDIAGLDHFKQSQDALNDEKYVSNALIGKIINEHLSSVYRYKGSVDSFDELPKDGNENGDVYDVAGGMNYAWNGTRWDELGDHMLEVDPALSSTSTNPVQNKAIKAELDKKAGTSVATASNNGLMSSDDKSRLDGINDYTTGINLFRGTRDFREGTVFDPFGTDTATYYGDGFRNSGGYTLYKDFDRFTAARREQSGLNADAAKYLHASVIHLEPYESLTISFEFMVEDVSAWDRQYLAFLGLRESGTTTTILSRDLSPSAVGVSKVESGVWYKAEYYVNPNSDKEADLRLSFYLIRNGAINIKKLNGYKGHINNPIWSASPFDVAQSNDLHPTIDLGLIDDDKRIQENEDLNTYTQAGTYACVATDIAKKVLNSPTGNAFKLYVDKTSGGNASYVRQILISYNALNSVYLRFSSNNGSTWSDWQDTRMFQAVRAIESGGTGGKTALEARNNLFGYDIPYLSEITDSSRFLFQASSSSQNEGMVHISTGAIVRRWLNSESSKITKSPKGVNVIFDEYSGFSLGIALAGTNISKGDRYLINCQIANPSIYYDFIVEVFENADGELVAINTTGNKACEMGYILLWSSETIPNSMEIVDSVSTPIQGESRISLLDRSGGGTSIGSIRVTSVYKLT